MLNKIKKPKLFIKKEIIDEKPENIESEIDEIPIKKNDKIKVKTDSKIKLKLKGRKVKETKTEIDLDTDDD